jgi:putative transposase
VPTHPPRYYGSGDLHFITASCYRRQLFLGTAPRRDLFLGVLERIRRRYRFAVLGYVIMPKHFHMLVTEPQRGTLSTVMQGLKLGFSRRLLSPGRALQPPALWPAPRRIWQPRFYDFNVWTERKRIEKLRYMHRNPVKRGLVNAPEQWGWSSFRFYLSLRRAGFGRGERYRHIADEDSRADGMRDRFVIPGLATTARPGPATAKLRRALQPHDSDSASVPATNFIYASLIPQLLELDCCDSLFLRPCHISCYNA